MIRIPRDFLDFLTLLNQHQVEYLLIGGYAVAFHGYVRATGDMDVFIRATEENGEKMRGVFEAFGVSGDFRGGLFSEPGKVFRLGIPPMRLEILNEISGVTFEECWTTAKTLRVAELDIPVISLECLLRNKAASGRDKDWVDYHRLNP